MKKENEEFYLIYEHGDPVRAGIVKSVLDEAGIDCYIKNDGVQNLFGLGSIGGINPLLGTVKVFIRPEDKNAAETLLSDLEAAAALGPEPEVVNFPEKSSDEESKKPETKGFLSRLREWIRG